MKCSIKKFSEMYETVYRDLYRYALCLMKNPQEAEDAVSEAVITAYELSLIHISEPTRPY